VSTAMEHAVARALHGDARDRDVDVTLLRTAALARARRIRLRRRLAGSVVAVVALLAGVGVVASRYHQGPSAEQYTAPKALPRVDAPGAAAAPPKVATDPSVIHFDVDPERLDATELTWRSGPDVESLAVRTADTGRYTVYVELARTRAALDGSGWGLDGAAPRPWYPPRPETGPWRELPPYTPEQLSGPDGYAVLVVPGVPDTVTRLPDPSGGDRARYSTTWSPVDGLWIQVEVAATGPEALVNVIGALRLDRSQACRVPAAVRPVPAGLAWVECETSLGGSWEYSTIALRGADGALVDVMFGNFAVAEPFVSNRSILGRQARAFTGAGGGPAVELPGGKGRALLVSDRTGRFPEETLVRLAEGFAFKGDAKDIETWPARPVS
jgi:hypothetical protein